MTMTTLKDKLTRHQIFLQRFAATQYNSMVPFIDNAVHRAMIRLGATTRYLSVIEAQNLEKELINLLEMMSTVTMQNLDDFARYESEFIAGAINGQLPVADKITKGVRLRKMGVGLNTGQQGQALPISLRQFNRHKARELAKKARQIAIQRLDYLETNIQFMQLANKIKAQARSLASTIVNHTASVAKDVTYQANKKNIDYVVWNSILDQNTTQYCSQQHGKQYPVNEGPRPPAHFGCRSFITAVLK